MKENNKPLTQEETEQDFKDLTAKIFKENVPETYVDKDGFIIIPRRRRKTTRDCED